MKTIKLLEERVSFCKSMISIESDKKRGEFIKYFEINVNDIGEEAWSNEEIDKILNRAIENIRIEIDSRLEIINHLKDKLKKIEYSIEHSDEKEFEDDCEETEYRVHLSGMRQATEEIINSVLSEQGEVKDNE